MSLMASSSTDEPSKIIGDANKDFINFNIDEGELGHIDFNNELKNERHLSAGVFTSVFDESNADLNHSEETNNDSNTGMYCHNYQAYTQNIIP